MPHVLANLPTPDPGDFWQFIVSAWALYMMYAKHVEVKTNKALAAAAEKEKPKREISGSIEMRGEKMPADKAEVDEEFERVGEGMKTLGEKMEAMEKRLLAAGEKREDRLTGHINKQLSDIRDESSRVIDSIRQQVNSAGLAAAAHAAHIEDLQARNVHQDSQITTLLQRPVCACSPQPQGKK